MTSWVEVSSGDLDAIERLGTKYAVHPLVLEDCVHRNQRPKLEDFETHQFLVWFMLAKERMYELQFIILPDRVVLVPHDQPPEAATWKEFLKIPENPKDLWHLVYQALDHATDITGNQVRKFHADIVDFESKMFDEECDPKTLLKMNTRLNQVEYSLGHLPSVAEQIKNFCKPKDDLRWKLRDLHDHCDRIYRNLNLYRSHITTTIELYWGYQANRSNRQIKKLSLLAAVAAPVTVWTSFWGMNFSMLPFNDEKIFWISLVAMGVSAILTVWLLVRKGYWSD